MMTLQMIADQQSFIDLNLSSDGVPLSPVVTIDTDAGRDLFSAADLQRIADRIHAASAICVAVTASDEVLEDVASAADVSIARASRGRGHTHVASVGSLDPWQEADDLCRRISATPVAALTLAWLARATEGLSVVQALAAESAAYSMLLGSTEFGRWLRERPKPRQSDAGERVEVTRDGNELRITLIRPGRRNAFDARMRDALTDALILAEADSDLHVELSGVGPVFSAGGDLDEFGSARDLGVAHLVRVSQSPGAVLSRIADRVHVRVHGACFGAGVELPAFAASVVATTDSTFTLPELRMGLLPGAGGTVSIPRRIGRQRFVWLALSGTTLESSDALAWGLVDSVST